MVTCTDVSLGSGGASEWLEVRVSFPIKLNASAPGRNHTLSHCQPTLSQPLMFQERFIKC